MKRSEGRILTTHAGRLPNPTNIREILSARADDPEKFDALMKGGAADMVRKQVALKNDLHSDGELKARDQMYYDSRATGVEMKPVTADKPAWLLPTNRKDRCPSSESSTRSTMPGEYPDARRDDPAGTHRQVHRPRHPRRRSSTKSREGEGIAALVQTWMIFSSPCSVQVG